MSSTPGITFAPATDADAAVENTMENDMTIPVLKAILLREGYIQRLQMMAKLSKKSLIPGFTDLLDIVRISSVEVVEAIVQWRRGTSRSAPFLWNGCNYLVKMPSDLDFLARNEPLVSWLGFNIERNPFIIPLSMENRPSSGGGIRSGREDGKSAQRHTSGCADHVSSASGYTRIGAAGGTPSRQRPHDKTKVSRIKKSAERDKKLRPYTTPVLNDPDLVPVVDDVAADLPAVAVVNDNASGPKNSKQKSSCSFVDDLDMIRIRDAEKVILAEEAIHGRFLRDRHGALVPAWKEERSRFAYELQVDDARPLNEPARVEHDLAPFASQSGFGHEPKASPHIPSPRKDEAREHDAKDDRSIGHNPYASGPSRAHKIGGELYSPPDPGIARGRKRPPIGRSRRAVIDFGITRRRRDNETLEQELSVLREKMQSIESESASDTVKDGQQDSTDQSENGAASAQEDCANLKKEIDEKEAMVEFNNQLIHEKEKLLLHLKQVEKRKEDTQRARELERKRRMLHENEVLPEDEEEAITLEDVCISMIQKLVRGRLVRRLYKKYRALCERSAATIQGGYRGMHGRRMATRFGQCHWAAVDIQRVYRGKVARSHFHQALRIRLQRKAAIAIQRRFRGVIGRARTKRRRDYVKAAKDAANAVSASQLLLSDLKDLARLIEDALIDSTRRVLPPPSVLNLVRLVCAMLGMEGSKDQVTSYSRLGVRSCSCVTKDMPWEHAMKVVRRGKKLLRGMRSMAMGPANKFPRRLVLPQDSINLYKALETDPTFSIEPFIGLNPKNRGSSRACCQMMRWVKALMAVNCQQDEFLAEDTNPSWLRTLRELQMERRKVLIRRHTHDASVDAIKASAGCDSDNTQALLREEEELELKMGKDLRSIDADISLVEKRQSNEERQRIEKAKTLHDKALTGVAIAKEALQEARRDLTMGLIEQCDVDELDVELGDKRTHLHDARDHLDLCMTLSAINDSKRSSSAIDLEDTLVAHCCDLGKDLAVVQILKAERMAVANRVRSSKLVVELENCQDDDDLIAINEKLAQAQQRHVAKEAILQKIIQENEAKIQSFHESESHVPPQTICPTDDPQDVAEDAEEDEVMALEERAVTKSFVPKKLLLQDIKPSPKIVLLSRDLPSFSKEKILEQLHCDFPGRLVRVSADKNLLGIDPKAFQRVLDLNQVVIADVDVGIGASTRGMFLHGFAVAKMALLKRPTCMCITGSHLNRRGHQGEAQLGVSESDLAGMLDGGKLKRGLETARQLTFELQGDDIGSAIKVVGEQETPPCKAFALVLEAVIVLLNPNDTFQNPKTKATGASWQGTRKFLVDDHFQKRLDAVDILHIPDHNLSVLESYVKHKSWPKKQEVEHGNDLLRLLCDWATSVVEVAVVLREAGGAPSDLSSGKPDSENVFDSFITVLDAGTSSSADADKEEGWKHAHNRVLLAFMDEMTVFKHTKDFENFRYDVRVCSGYEKIWFFATDPEDRYTTTTALNLGDVDSLLAPNSVQVREEGEKRIPPENRVDLYARLCQLLVLERDQTKSGETMPVLACRRRERILLRETRTISGHLATVAVSEEGLGILRFHVYVPTLSVKSHVVVTEEMLLEVLRCNADHRFEAKELQSSNAQDLLRPVTDRLILSPRKRTVTDMGATVAGPESSPYGSRRMSLNIRRKGGAGRELFSCIHMLSGTRHVVSVREVGRGGPLLVRTYSNSKAADLEVCIAAVHRTLCLGAAMGDWKSWRNTLMSRLSVQQRRHKDDEGGLTSANGTSDGECFLHFDGTIFSTTQNLGKDDRSFAIRIVLEPMGSGVEIYFTNAATEEEHLLRVSEVHLKNIFSSVTNTTTDVRVQFMNGDDSFRTLLSYISYDDKDNQMRLQTSEGTVCSSRHTSPSVPYAHANENSVNQRNFIVRRESRGQQQQVNLTLSPETTQEGSGDNRYYFERKVDEDSSSKAESTGQDKDGAMTLQSSSETEGDETERTEDDDAVECNQFVEVEEKEDNEKPTLYHERKGDAAASVNAVAGVASQGSKVFRKVCRVSGVLLHITGFALFSDDEASRFPSMRFIGYNPDSSQKLVLLIPSSTVEAKLVQDQQPEYYKEHSNLYRMAEVLSSHLVLVVRKTGSMPKLLLDSDDAASSTPPILVGGNVWKPGEERQRRISTMPNLLLRRSFNLSCSGTSHSSYDCIVSVFPAIGDDSKLTANIYVPSLSSSCEVAIPKDDQAIGRLEGTSKESLHVGLSNAVSRITLSVEDDKGLNAIIDGNPKNKHWHSAYARAFPGLTV